MMRRRRPLSRLVNRLVGPPVPPLLIEANRHFEMGDYPGAAERFEQLALRSEGRRPRHIARMLVEAGRARLLAGQDEAAMRHFRQGLSLLAEHRRYRELKRLGDRLISELRERGYTRQAAEISAWLTGQLAVEMAPEPSAPDRRPLLPTRCPSCGGPLDPRDVEWVDEMTVECGYCGGMVRAEEG